MKEEEAKTKWCFAARMDGNNRHWGSERHIGSCIGSECMAWRWDDVANPSWGASPHVPTPAVGKSETDGFCGLGGKP